MIKTVFDLATSPNLHLIKAVRSKKLKILTSQCITSKNSHTFKHTHAHTFKILRQRLINLQKLSVKTSGFDDN